MSGDGGGGSSKKDKKPVEEAARPMTTVQPFMPGMDQLLAQQLAAGFGGNPQDFLSAFAQTYGPMQVPSYSPQAPASPATPTTPAAPTTPKPTTPAAPQSGGNRGRGYQWGGHT